MAKRVKGGNEKNHLQNNRTLNIAKYVDKQTVRMISLQILLKTITGSGWYEVRKGLKCQRPHHSRLNGGMSKLLVNCDLVLVAGLSDHSTTAEVSVPLIMVFLELIQW